MKEIDKQLELIFNELIPYKEIKKNINLFESEILDSLSVMVLINEIEDIYDIEIKQEDIIKSNFESIDKISKLIDKYRGSR